MVFIILAVAPIRSEFGLRQELPGEGATIVQKQFTSLGSVFHRHALIVKWFVTGGADTRLSADLATNRPSQPRIDLRKPVITA